MKGIAKGTVSEISHIRLSVRQLQTEFSCLIDFFLANKIFNCCRTYESKGGNCAPKTTPKTTIQPKKTTITVTPRRRKTSLPTTPKISTTKPSSPLNEPGKNGTNLTTPWRSFRNPLKATGEMHVVSGLRNIMFKFATNQRSPSLLRFLLHVTLEWHANSLIAWEISSFYLKTKKFHV